MTGHTTTAPCPGLWRHHGGGDRGNPQASSRPVEAIINLPYLTPLVLVN